MILVDTSVWIDHFRIGNTKLTQILEGPAVLTHPFVIGELSCGNLKSRAETVRWLRALPTAVVASDIEVGQLIEDRRLWGQGIGWTDAHLLASSLLTNCHLWTRDTRLASAARAAGVKMLPD